MKTTSIQSYVNRDRWLVERCRGQRVLHLGCVGFTDCSSRQKVEQARLSLHHQLSEVCDCTGIDLDTDTINELRTAGIFSNVVTGNVEQLEEFTGKLQPFDLVVAGDIIEHLSNPGLMLDGAKLLLKPEGRLIVSTPNTLGLLAHVRHCLNRYHEGEQHVLGFNAITLGQILERHGYETVAIHTCHHRHATKAPGLLFALGCAFFKAFPKFGGTMIFEARMRAGMATIT